jgi:hypothetical protein
MTSKCRINVNKLKRMPKEEPASYFQLLSQSIPPEIEGGEKIRKNVGKLRLSPNRDSKPQPPQYEKLNRYIQ